MADPFLGEIRLFAFDYVPTGWMSCDGQVLNIQTNQALYALLGTTYGGNGTTTFALPNLNGRVPIHLSGAYPLGTSAGEATHLLSVQEIPAHTHASLQAVDAPATTNNPSGAAFGRAAASVGSAYSTTVSHPVAMHTAGIAAAGGSLGHQNMQPFLTLVFAIAIIGTFPSRN